MIAKAVIHTLDGGGSAGSRPFLLVNFDSIWRFHVLLTKQF